MPDFLPDRLEAGTHNVPGIAGLLSGIRFVEEIGTDAIQQHECALCRRAEDGLVQIPGMEVFQGPEQMGVLSFRRRPWGRLSPGGASPCGRGFTAPPWPMGAPGPWRPAPSGPVSLFSTGRRRWTLSSGRRIASAEANLEQTVNFSADFLALMASLRYNMLVKECPMVFAGP